MNDPHTEGPAASDGPPLPLRVSFLWDRREHARVAQRLMLDRLRKPILGIPLATVLVLTGLIVAWDLWRAITRASLEPLRGSAVLILLEGAVVWLLVSGFGQLQAILLGRSDPRLAHPMSNTLDTEGVAVETNAGSSFLPWSGMPRVLETDECFLWYWHRGAVQYTPKRAFAAEDLPRVRALVRDHVTTQVDLRSD